MQQIALKPDPLLLRSRSIVVRMRIAMAFIAILVLGLIIVGAVGLSRVNDSQEALTEKAIPGLVRVDILENLLSDVDDSFGQMVSAQTVQQQDAFQQHAVVLISRIRDATASSLEFGKLIDDFEASIVVAGSVSAEVRAARGRLIACEAKFADASEEFLEQIETLMLDTSIAVERLALVGEATSSGQGIAEGLLTITALTRLGYLTERNRDLTFAALSSGRQLDLSEMEERLAFNFRAIVRHLTQLGDSPQRASMVANVQALRRLVLGADGLISIQQQLIDFEHERDAASLAHERISDAIWNEARIGITDARSNILSTAEAVGTSVDSMIFQSRLMGIAALVLIAAVAIFLVERRIIRRLGQLSASVREIAGGNNDAPITVTGDDELGEMSKALEVFKGNSLELQRSNAELARFAYAASHDLRSPLRAIHNLAQWTLEDAGDALPEECRDNLELLLGRAKRLSELLNALLDYSRVGRKAASIGLLSISDVVSENLELLGKERNFSVEYTGTSRRLQTYEAPLRQILMNLISNAVKHHDAQTGVISLDCQMEGDRVRIAVSDDGPGIDPKYHERVFGLFETLQSRDEVEGSGMGLAIIRKQVEHYGGKIKITSNPSDRRGTTFTFDWPTETASAADQLAA